MRIGLHDAEKDSMPGKTFPNYALMKISAYHKAKGDSVEWWVPVKNGVYDRIYSSKVFDFTPTNPYLPETAIRGGTGYSDIPKARTLPLEVDAMYPDYSIYPACDYAIGFLTRGCPNRCPWCVVPEKEGSIRPYRVWREVVRSDTDKLVLMDNNILACTHGVEQLEDMIGSGIRIDLNQGMDARLVDDAIARLLVRLKWIRFMRFSCDQQAQIAHIYKVYERIKRYGGAVSRIFVYTLIGKDLDEADSRIQALNKLTGISIYAQAERNEVLGIRPSAAQLEFANRYVYGRLYKRETWSEYCERKKIVYADGVEVWRK